MPDLVALARGFQGELRRRAAEIESGRMLPVDIASRFAQAGFYRACVPIAYGGLEQHPLITLKTIEALAEGDGSAGWCVMIGATSGLVSAYMPEVTAKRVFQDETVIVAGVLAARGTAKQDGNAFVVNGRWQWGSGSPNARMIMGGCVVYRDGKPVLLPNGMPESRMMMVPIEAAALHDNWDVAGLSGSGSQDFSIHDCRVPADMSIGLLTDRPLAAPLYAFPVFGMLAAGVASVMIGIAASSIRELVSIALAKTPEGHRKPLATRSRAQEDTAEAEALVRSARGFLHETIESAWNEAQGGAPLSTNSRRAIRLAATHAARSSMRAVDLMYHLAGGSSVYRNSPLQRMFRDIHVASQHMMVAPPTMETVGRLLLEQDTDTSQL